MGSLKENLEAAKNKLKTTTTRITREDGSQFTESHEGGVHKVRRSNSIGGSGYGFVVDTKPDLQIAQIRPFLFVGAQDVAASEEILDQNKITHVLNVATGIDNYFPNKYEYLRIEILDSPESDLGSVLPRALEFLEQCKANGGRAFVHCNAGISRSVSVVIAYLMKYERLSFDAALLAVKSVRLNAYPNQGFRAQLLQYEKDLFESKNLHLVMETKKHLVQTKAFKDQLGEIRKEANKHKMAKNDEEMTLDSQATVSENLMCIDLKAELDQARRDVSPADFCVVLDSLKNIVIAQKLYYEQFLADNGEDAFIRDKYTTFAKQELFLNNYQ